jgi:hypothetical protein
VTWKYARLSRTSVQIPAKPRVPPLSDVETVMLSTTYSLSPIFGVVPVNA